MKHNTAIILAAGRGSRLKEMSLEHPKPMVIIKDSTIISNLVHLLLTHQYDRIVIVVGYKAEKLKAHLNEQFPKINFIFVENKLYQTTNNIYSLWLTKSFMQQGFSLFEADVFCRESIIDALSSCQNENAMLVAPYEDYMNGSVVTLDKNNYVVKLFLKSQQTEKFNYSKAYKTVNFYNFAPAFVNNFFLPRLAYHIHKSDVRSFYEVVIQEALRHGYVFQGLIADNRDWCEIDTQDDLELARKLLGRKYENAAAYIN
ncbi:MAG TPA: phosphocholine cytidylyltransferase family protein [Candidatus Cloacimonadota bacterium]|nr:phosphocholine cytidylyltransferase family protein [Candidatus Cloacimonadota bacterium]